VPGVFVSPFQSAPLDFDTDAFFPARKDLIEARLQQIALGDANQLIEGVWSKHFGEFCRGVRWSSFSLSQLLVIADCIGGVGLSVVLRLMAEDHAGSSGGLPDLLLWRTEPAKEARFVEVKGPTDRLSDQQRAWLACMSAVGMDVEVCKVLES
jgi:Fanconi-associated nuclease 1